MVDHGRRTRPPKAAIFAGAALVLLATHVAPAQLEPDAGRAVLEKWVETKRIISAEQQDWRGRKAILEDRIELVRRETATLEEMTAALKGNIGEADEKLAELQATQEALMAATQGVGEDIALLEPRVLALLARAPAPIVERVRALSQRIPKPGSETSLSLSQRFQNIIGVLNELNKFSREITVTSEVRDQPDGTKAEVTVMYLGIAQAYYCNEASGVAGVGRPATNGWAWSPHNEICDRVADAIAIYRNEKPAGYILLPGMME